MYSISFASDEHYSTPAALGSVTYENGKQVWATPLTVDRNKRRKLVSLYAFNSSGATVYLGVFDSPDGGVTLGRFMGIYPVYQGSFLSRGIHGGERVELGLWVEAFTDLQMTTPAGTVMYYEIDYTAY